MRTLYSLWLFKVVCCLIGSLTILQFAQASDFSSNDPWKVLNLEPTHDEAMISARYRSLMMEYHRAELPADEWKYIQQRLNFAKDELLARPVQIPRSGETDYSERKSYRPNHSAENFEEFINAKMSPSDFVGNPELGERVLRALRNQSMKLQTEGGLVVVNSAFRQSVLNHLRGRINSIEDFELLQKFIEGSNFIWTQSPNPKIYQAVDGLLRLNEISDVDYRESLKIFAGHFTQFFYSSYRAYGRPKGMFERYLDFLIQFTNKPPPEWVYANLRLGESSIRFKYEFHQLLLHVQTIEQLQIINRMVALSEENRLVRVNLDIISIMHEMLLKDPSQVQSLSIILKKVEQTSRNFSSSTDVFKEIRENFLEKKIFFTNRYSNSLFIEFGEKYSDLIATVENPYQQLALKAFIEADKRQELKFLTIRLLVKRRLKSIQTQSQADRFVRATVRWNGATDLIIKSQATLPHRSCRKVFSN